MYEIITDWIYTNLTWYNIMIIISLLVGLGAGYVHKTGIPILWTGILSLVLIWGKTYLEPMITGLYYFDINNYTVLSIMLAIMSISWLIIIAITHYNLIYNGKVIN